MRTWFQTMLSWRKPAQQAVGPDLLPGTQAQRATTGSAVMYPPMDPGLPVAEAGTIVADQADIVRMLKIHAAVEPAMFETRFLAPIVRLAEHVNLLPGTAQAAYSGAGGLFRAAVETAFNAFRASDGRIFTGDLGVEMRHKLEARWRYVCFLSGLLYPLGGSLRAMSVSDLRRNKWACELEPLAEWARRNHAERIYVSWADLHAVPGPHPITGTLALQVAGRANVEWLNEGSQALVNSLIGIVTGAPGARELIAREVVNTMWESVQQREASRRPQNYGRLTIGTDVAPYLLDAVVSLWRGTWKLNESVSYADKSGIYLQWPQAGDDIIRYCRSMDYTGIPATDAALLDLLVSNKLVDPGVSGMAITHIADSSGEIVGAVKVAKPALLLQDDQTLESIAAGRPVAMAEVRAADPLAPPAAPPAPAKAPAVPAVAPSLEQIDPSEVLAAEGGKLEQLAGMDGADLDAATAPPPTQAPLPRPQPAEPPAKPSSGRRTPDEKIAEGQEVRFADLLPPEVVKSLLPFHSELLGRLVHIWRSGSAKDRVMRICEHGAAIDLKLLADMTQDPPGFLQALSEQGWIYTSRETPGKKIYPVTVSEGSQTTGTCFILPHHVVRKLALQ